MAGNSPTRIQLCGRLAVESEGRELTARGPGGQARLLFTYLAVNRARPARRDELIEALWPWRIPAGADASLSALLSRLRTMLGGPALTGGSEIRLALPADAWIDIEAAPGGDPPSGVGGRAGRLGARLGTVADRTLHGPTRLSPRERTFRGPTSIGGGSRRSGAPALECYAAVALGVGGTELAPGERVARELVAAEPFRERAHALLMEILVARGNAAEALRVYDALRERLRDEEPEPHRHPTPGPAGAAPEALTA